MERQLAAASSDTGHLVELSRLLVGAAYRSLEAVGAPLPLAQFRALAVLALHGPCTAGGLASALDQHPSTVTRLGDKLVAAGWVTRTTRPENRREVELDVTAAGRRLVDEVLAARAAEMEEVLRQLPSDARRQLAPLLPALISAATAALGAAPFGWAV